MKWQRASIFTGSIAVAALVGIVAGTWASAGSKYPAEPSPYTQASIQSVVETFFAGDLNKDVTPPTSAEVVLTTRGEAIQAVGPWVDYLNDPGTPIYLVQLTGDFVGYNEPVPPGTDPPQGKALFVFYDPSTTGVLGDYGIGAQPWDLSKLGNVYDIPVDFASSSPPPSASASASVSAPAE